MNSRKIPHVPEGTEILAYTDVVAKSGRAVRLYVSDVWQHRIWGMQVIVAVDKSLVVEGATVLPKEGLGYVRAIWNTLERIDLGVETFGGFASKISGKSRMESEATLADYFRGRPYLGDIQTGKWRELRESWEQLWQTSLWRNTAWVEYAETEKEARREGLALLMYPALSQVLDEEGIKIMSSNLLSPLAEEFWKNSGCQRRECMMAGEKRARIVPGKFEWQAVKPIVKESGVQIIELDKYPKAPKLTEDVSLDMKVSELVNKLTPKKLVVPSAENGRLKGAAKAKSGVGRKTSGQKTVNKRGR